MKELFMDNYSDSIFPHELEESNLGDMKCVKNLRQYLKNVRLVQVKNNTLVLV